MTYEELFSMTLAINNKVMSDQEHHGKMARALRVVIERHKPFDFDTDEPRCSRCIDATTENGRAEFMSSLYPCETIQAIEKELL